MPRHLKPDSCWLGVHPAAHEGDPLLTTWHRTRLRIRQYRWLLRNAQLSPQRRERTERRIAFEEGALGEIHQAVLAAGRRIAHWQWRPDWQDKRNLKPLGDWQPADESPPTWDAPRNK